MRPSLGVCVHFIWVREESERVDAQVFRAAKQVKQTGGMGGDRRVAMMKARVGMPGEDWKMVPECLGGLSSLPSLNEI